MSQLDLPTPPSSISPAINAHSLKYKSTVERKDKGGGPAVAGSENEDMDVDSDLDLREAAAHTLLHTARRATQASLAVTAPVIASEFLPGIMLDKGPLAMRYIMSSLSHQLPGFSELPTAKARRMVTSALETRLGGKDGGVLFEKVGWGRWIAKRRNCAGIEPNWKPSADRLIPPAQPVHISAAKRSYEAHLPGSFDGFSSSGNAENSASSIRSSLATSLNRRESNTQRVQRDIDSEDYMGDDLHDEVDEYDIATGSSGRYPGLDTLVRGHDRRVSMASSSRATGTNGQDDSEDTDEEDWSQLGAQALRKSSFVGPASSYSSATSGLSSALPERHFSTSLKPGTRSHPISPALSAISGRTRGGDNQQLLFTDKKIPAGPPPLSLDFAGVQADDKEKDAIEALMRMGGR